MRIQLTDAAVATLSVPHPQRITIYDKADPYLALIVSPLGRASFYYIRKLAGKTQFVKLCPGTESVKTARQRAETCSKRYMLGLPLRDVPERPAPPPERLTLRRVCETWIAAKSQRDDPNGNVRQNSRRIARYVPAALLDRPVDDLRRADMQQLLFDVAKQTGQRTANLLLVNLKAAINYAIKMELPVTRNPAAGVEHFRTESRSRFLHHDELGRFFAALEESESEDFRDFVKLALFTGKRRANVLGMRWEWIDFAARTLTIPAASVKSRSEDVTALDPAAMAILERRYAARGDSPFVIPSPYTRSGHYGDPKKSWQTLRERSGLRDLRIHDLRRTLASWMAANGESMLTISRCLGQTTTSATAVYARLDVAPRRKAVAGAVSQILAAAGETQKETPRAKLERLLDADPALAERLLAYA